jgi:hypothetical protein
MTTTDTFGSVGAMAVLRPVLLAAALVGGVIAGPAPADTKEQVYVGRTAPIVVPEPATVLFMGVAGAALFRRRRRRRPP